jgi:hypothetical protein
VCQQIRKQERIPEDRARKRAKELETRVLLT